MKRAILIGNKEMQLLHGFMENPDLSLGFVLAMGLGTLCALLLMEWLALGAFISAGVYMEKFFIRVRSQNEPPKPPSTHIL